MNAKNQKNYDEVIAYLESQYEEVEGCAFYQEIFPGCESSGEMNDDYSKPNAIYLYQDDAKGKVRRRIMLSDQWVDDYMEFIERNPFTLCGGLAYRGRSNTLEHAQRMNALIIDLDSVGEDEIISLFLRIRVDRSNPFCCPVPTFLVASGTGLHIYYVFKEPIDLFPNIKVQMKNLKYALTYKLWSPRETSQEESVQYQSINQGFRMVGSINGKYGTLIRAFRIGDKVDIEELNICVDEENRVDAAMRFRPSKMTKEQAKECYPEWYERVIVNGQKRSMGKWDIAGKVHGDDPLALYHWWLQKVKQASAGHRYFFMMCTVIYASKCDVPRKKLKKDLRAVFEELSKIHHKNELTEQDMKSALEMYSKEYWCFTIEDISKLTMIPIQRNKRNYQKQADHLEEARAIRDVRQRRKGTDWRDGNGRPSAEAKVRVWREEHPDGKKIECERDTGLSRHTVLKWWDPAKKGYQSALAEKREVPTVNESPIEYGRPRVWTLGDGIPRKRMLPDAYVVEGDPDMLGRMMSYATKGIRSVEILTGDEYDEMAVNEHWRMFYRDRYKGVVFKESELEPWFMELVRDYGLQVKVMSDGDNDD